MGSFRSLRIIFPFSGPYRLTAGQTHAIFVLLSLFELQLVCYPICPLMRYWISFPQTG
jgi:hypothetical protein